MTIGIAYARWIRQLFREGETHTRKGPVAGVEVKNRFYLFGDAWFWQSEDHQRFQLALWELWSWTNEHPKVESDFISLRLHFDLNVWILSLDLVTATLSKWWRVLIIGFGQCRPSKVCKDRIIVAVLWWVIAVCLFT